MAPVPVNPAALPAPSGYSHGTLAGNTLYLGGQTALDADMKIVPGGIVEQFRQAFGNVLTTLREAGGVPEDLVSVTIYLTDMKTFGEMNAVWDGWISPGNTPARATVEVKLAGPKYGVEIMVIAAK